MSTYDNQLEYFATRYHGYLWTIAHANLGSRFQGKLDASDIVQATFMKAHTTFKELRARDDMTVVAWLRTVLTSVLIDEIRKLYREKRNIDREFSIAASVNSSAMSLEYWLQATQTSPSMVVMKNERLLGLADALLLLPVDQRDVVIMKHLRGLTLFEISEETGRSIPAVAGLLRRGLEKLREIVPPE